MRLLPAYPRPIATRLRTRTILGSLLVLSLGGCDHASETTFIEQELGRTAQAISAWTPPKRPSTEKSIPPNSYTLFEADPVRPIAVLKRSKLVAVTNTVDDYLELLRSSYSGLTQCGQVKVGLRPVAVAVVKDRKHSAELWVSNHLSDSISVVKVNTKTCRATVIDTLYVGDEPRDIVVARGYNNRKKVFVATTHRGQHHPEERARSGADLVAPPSDKISRGMADVFVFDPRDRDKEPEVVNLFTDRARALTVSGHTVYAAGFHTGNGTAAIAGDLAVERGMASLTALVQTDESGSFIEVGGQLVLRNEANEPLVLEGGMPAVLGQGRCMPDPRPDRTNLQQQQLCIATDSEHHALTIVPQIEGQVDEQCHCGSGDGTQQPIASIVVQFFKTPEQCKGNFHTFPNGTEGCWLDAALDPALTPAANRSVQTPAMAWNEEMRFTLPDQDVFAINADDLSVENAFSGVGTVLFSMAVHPKSGKLFVTNTDASNLTRFEGHGDNSSTTVRGHLHESRITVIDPKRGRVRPVHLNDHIDYSQCCERTNEENERSFAFPTAGVFSDNGKHFFFTALGSNKVGLIKSSSVGPRFKNTKARRRGKLREVSFGNDLNAPAGPVGLAWDKRFRRLYVKTHFSNEIAVIDTNKAKLTQRISLASPEPADIRDGRHVLYNARLTSSHGDSACASCHVFGDLDSLAWDLGDPDGITVNNPGPYALSPEHVNAEGIAVDPAARNPANLTREADFRSNKGAMTTQTLRGMDNHGAQHWRGDRTRRFAGSPGEQPNFGSLDEFNSFGEFDVAVVGLNGNDKPLDQEVFDAFTTFALQLTLPPNPIRQLDNSLTEVQGQARALYFGCLSMTEEQYANRQCIALNGNLVDIDEATAECICATNPFIGILQTLPSLVGFASLLGPVVAFDPQFQLDLDNAFVLSQLPVSAEPTFAAARTALSSLGAALASADVSLSERGLLPESTASLAAQSAGTLLGLSEFLSAITPEGGDALLQALASSFAANGAAGSPIATVPGVVQATVGLLAASNLNVRTHQDLAAEGTGEFRNVLNDCPIANGPECSLRTTDAVHTCHGCHTLDPQGNAEFGVARPGFFGTSGGYSFENESQILKVPHLRNAYQKAGMFGTPQFALADPLSNLGVLAEQTPFVGDQVRGFGFAHDGTLDTIHRFFTGLVFGQSLTNAGGFNVAVPPIEDQEACMGIFRQVSPTVLEPLPEERQQQLALCLADSPLSDVCFLEPKLSECRSLLADLDAAATLPGVSLLVSFESGIRPLCFALGFDVDNRTKSSVCYSQGARERDQLADFTLAFDTNMKPMVGQQLTLAYGETSPPMLTQLLDGAARGLCDLAARIDGKGWLVSEPNSQFVDSTELEDAEGNTITWDTLRAQSAPLTLTCYPPQPEQAEARRSAFERSDSWAGKTARHSHKAPHSRQHWKQY